MPHPTPYPRCIFCGAKANSHEHAIPKWIGKRFGIAQEELKLELGRGVRPRRKQPLRFGSHRERIFCKQCNAHFSSLEEEAAPIIEWMGRGRAVTLGMPEQDILARWGAKTGYAILAAASKDFDLDDVLPFEHRQLLRDSGIVSPCTCVAYTSWDGYINRVVTTDLLKSRSNQRVPRSYLVILTFAQVGLQVFGVDELLPSYSFSLDRKGLKQVFPRLHENVTWPVSPKLGDSALRSFIDDLS